MTGALYRSVHVPPNNPFAISIRNATSIPGPFDGEKERPWDRGCQEWL